jgi:hypothetical protein
MDKTEISRCRFRSVDNTTGSSVRFLSATLSYRRYYRAYGTAFFHPRYAGSTCVAHTCPLAPPRTQAR